MCCNYSYCCLLHWVLTSTRHFPPHSYRSLNLSFLSRCKHYKCLDGIESQSISSLGNTPAWHQQPCSPHSNSLQSPFLLFLMLLWPSPVISDWTLKPLQWLVSAYLTWATNLVNTLHCGPYGWSAAISTMHLFRLLIFGMERAASRLIYSLTAELSPRPWADIISKQQTEEQHAGRVIATLGQVRRRRETSPRGDYICFIRHALEIRTGSVTSAPTVAREWKATGLRFTLSFTLLVKISNQTRFQCHFVPDLKDSKGKGNPPLLRLVFSLMTLINTGKYVNVYQTSTEA